MRFRYEIKFTVRTNPPKTFQGEWESDEVIGDLECLKLRAEISQNINEDIGTITLPEHITIEAVNLVHDRGVKIRRGILSNYKIERNS